MEDVYTIKVKTKPDTRNLYPSERRYSASTVSGLAWVHIALAATSFLLACLALVNPTDTKQDDIYNATGEFNETLSVDSNCNYILVLAPSLLTISALAAGLTSILASVKWYIDNNITWLFIMSITSTIFSVVAFFMVAVWFISTEGQDISQFYKDKEPFKDIFIVKHADVLFKNESHMVIAKNATSEETTDSHLFTKSVLSINILIAAFLEFLWSILSLKISYKGMRNDYKDDVERRGNCVAVVTTIKGNTKKMPRNGKLIPPKPDLIEHYPSQKIQRMFLAQDNSFYLKNQNNKNKNTETSSDFYKERMMNFLNRCASMEGISNPERCPSVQSESILNVKQETNAQINSTPEREYQDSRATLSWGDTPDHTIYNQNNINFDRIFKFGTNSDSVESVMPEECSEKLNN